MKEGQWDYITSELKDKMKYVKDSVRLDFKNVKPYRKEPLTSADFVAQYMNLPRETLPQLRQNLPGFNEYEQKVFKAMNRIKGVKNG